MICTSFGFQATMILLPTNTDEEVKKATQGDSSDPKHLPLYHRKGLPHSITVLHQDFAARLSKHWSRCWKTSLHTKDLCSIDNSQPLKKFLQPTKDLNHSQASIIMQLHTGHIGLINTCSESTRSSCHLVHITRA